jgi:hypothetical protein
MISVKHVESGESYSKRRMLREDFGQRSSNWPSRGRDLRRLIEGLRYSDDSTRSSVRVAARARCLCRCSTAYAWCRALAHALVSKTGYAPCCRHEAIALQIRLVLTRSRVARSGGPFALELASPHRAPDDRDSAWNDDGAWTVEAGRSRHYRLWNYRERDQNLDVSLGLQYTL